MKSLPTNIGVESLTYKVWRVLVAGALIWWVIGLNLIIYHFAAGLFFMGMIYVSNRVESDGIVIPPSAKHILCISIFYALSIILNVFFVGGGMSRLIAALYNLSFWFMGFMIITSLANAYKGVEITPLLRGFSRLAWVIASMSFMVLIFWVKGSEGIQFQSLLSPIGKILGGSQLIRDSLSVSPLQIDWFASASRPRFNVFSPYPTAAGGVIMITLMMLQTRFLIERKKAYWHFWLVFGFCVLGLVMTLSRTSMIAFLFALILVSLLERRYITFWLFLAIGLFFVSLPFLLQGLGAILEMRSGSTSVRMDLYRYSIEKLQGVDWLLGFGVKAREQAFFIPLGSHSTFISLLYKSGLFGFFAYLIFQVSLLWRWFSLKAYVVRRRKNFLFWRGLGLVFFSMFLWTITEDIDAPQLLAFLYFSMIGVFEGFRRKVRT